ncbi:hypothetical protein JRO89_XSUnG0079900 [Xanthoceras sorbifolium]|uniref:Protein kinase domain-containing protein n=1 Tax=Xanthoceras sorbifolium TaxID=99658 RepID=A0ABQ8GZL8_9ROSI|nr:hypothetical protein JRO89_XSUnG0079900 [Xanthoceras sorbifolium]
MITPSLPFVIILLLWPVTASATLKNCTSKCGDVTIPFPFGIGDNCSIDVWFTIDCRRNKPYLRNIDLEVLDISLDGTMRVSYSIYNTCNQNKSVENTAYLENTPFIFSQTRNKFIGVGCGKFFFMSYDDSPIAQCTTTCDSNNKTRENSYCQDVVVSSLKRYDPYFEELKQACNYAVLVEQQCCYSSPTWAKPEKLKVNMIILGLGTSLGSLFLLFGAVWMYKIMKKRKEVRLKETFFKRNGGLLLQQQLTSFDGSVDGSKLFSSKELDKATDYFNVNRILGQGGQGTVYKGMLEDGRIIAVKKSKVIDEERLEEFINEVAILSQINHRNVVKLLGCCLETEVPLLVYEFIPNGTLFQYVHNQNEELPLTWTRRLRIAIEVAGALSYLHSAASLPIYHRDIKSANILLDDKYRVKIADFGTSRSIAIDQTHVTTLVQGTFGYLDPEYFQSSKFTDKSDVYSFGVVLVELLTGQKPISSARSQDNRSLAIYFILSMEENKLFDILDPQVIKQGKKQEIMIVANLAMRCINLNGKKRPTMKEVALVLEGVRASQKDSNVHDEFEYVRTEVIEPWDISTSTDSLIDNIAPPVDVQPLLTYLRSL